jgi:hypothetical protein
MRGPEPAPFAVESSTRGSDAAVLAVESPAGGPDAAALACDAAVLVVESTTSAPDTAVLDVESTMRDPDAAPLAINAAPLAIEAAPLAAEKTMLAVHATLRASSNACDGRRHRARFYCDLVRNSVSEAARWALEAMMKSYEYQSDFAKKYYGEGLDQGLARGRMQGEAHALLTVLRARGIAVPEAARQRILAETDQARLERWLERAGTSATVADVLDEPS